MTPEMIDELQNDPEYNAWLDLQELYAQEQEQPEDFEES
jgi:hypothetical protein